MFVKTGDAEFIGIISGEVLDEETAKSLAQIKKSMLDANKEELEQVEKMHSELN